MSAPRKALPVPGAASPKPPAKTAPKPPAKVAPVAVPRPVAPAVQAPVAVPAARSPSAVVSPRPLPAASSAAASPPARALPTTTARPLPPAKTVKAAAAPQTSTAAAVAARRALPAASRLAGMRGRPPPPPPRSPPPEVPASSSPAPGANGKSGGSGIRRMPTAGARKRAPTIVPAAALLQEAEEKRCRECGAGGVEDFCADCGARAVEKKKPLSVAPPEPVVVEPQQSLDDVLAEAGAHLKQKKICMECYSEGYDAFCADCGGKMLACDSDDEDDGAPLDEDEEIAATVSAEAAKQSAAAPTTVLPTLAVAPVVQEWVDPGNSEKVFCIDIGTEYTRFGYSNETEPLKVRSCVDGRANSTHNFLQIRGQIFPFDGSEAAFAGNDYLGDLIRRAAKMCNYSGQVVLCVSTVVPPNSDGVSDWVFSIADGQVFDKCPSALYVGYSPVLSLCAASGSCYPTGMVVEIGASSCVVVPVYSGMKVDHCIVSSPFGGRMFQEFLQSRCPALAKSDEPAMAKLAREACYVSADFRGEMAKRGFEVTAANASQAWRGFRTKNAALADQKDGNGLGVEAFCGPELYFQPSLVSKFSFASVQDMIRAAMSSIPCIPVEELLGNVVVSGEAGLLRGFPERLTKELSGMFPGVAVCVTSAPLNSAWHGAKLLASRSTFPRMCTTELELQSLSHASVRFF